MSEITLLVEKLGTTGALLWVIWKLTNKWAEKFLDVQFKQATALSDLAGAVKENQGEQRELLLAVRVQSQKLEEMTGWIREMCEKGGCRPI
jgi:hypothetical protein